MKAKRWYSGVLVRGLAFVLSGWPMTPATAQTATSARLVVYRPYKFTGLPMQYALFQDRQPLARLGNGRYVSSTVPAGMVTLRSHVVGFLWPVQRERVLHFPAQAGQIYYVQTDASFQLMTLNMALVPAAFAQEQLGQGLKPSPGTEALPIKHP